QLSTQGYRLNRSASAETTQTGNRHLHKIPDTSPAGSAWKPKNPGRCSPHLLRNRGSEADPNDICLETRNPKKMLSTSAWKIQTRSRSGQHLPGNAKIEVDPGEICFEFRKAKQIPMVSAWLVRILTRNPKIHADVQKICFFISE